MKIFGYVRVSTAEQAANGDSLETQKAKITGYAMMQGWTVAEIFVEGGVSGSIALADRPQGQPLLAAAGKGDMIITPKLDRMFRSASDALGTLEELKGLGVGLVMIDLGGDVTAMAYLNWSSPSCLPLPRTSVIASARSSATSRHRASMAAAKHHSAMMWLAGAWSRTPSSRRRCAL